MPARYQNIVNTDRVRLEEVIPLRMPYSIFIDPSEVCNFRCSFCAMQDKNEKLPYKRRIMDFDLYRKTIDDLKKFPGQLKMLRLALHGEPLMNPRFPDMVRYAKEANVAQHIETVTNGSLLNPELNRRIIDAGIDRVRISVESVTEEGYARISGVKLDMDKFLNNIRDLHERSGRCEIYCKIVDIAVPTDAEKKRFSELFGDVCDKYFIDSVIPHWSDYDRLNEIKEFNAGTQRGLHGQSVRDVRICPIVFYTLAVHADGQVGVCCSDWRRELIFGDLSRDSLPDIWNSEKLFRFWLTQAAGKRDSIKVCARCMNPVYDCSDYLDPYSETICGRLTELHEEAKCNGTGDTGND